MPFANAQVYPFTASTIATIRRIGGVYGLARSARPGFSTILYVGKAEDLRERLSYWLNNPPGPGVEHFFVEVITNEAARTLREAQLIKEFQPVYNTLLK